MSTFAYFSGEKSSVPVGDPSKKGPIKIMAQCKTHVTAGRRCENDAILRAAESSCRIVDDLPKDREILH